MLRSTVHSSALGDATGQSNQRNEIAAGNLHGAVSPTAQAKRSSVCRALQVTCVAKEFFSSDGRDETRRFTLLGVWTWQDRSLSTVTSSFIAQMTGMVTIVAQSLILLSVWAIAFVLYVSVKQQGRLLLRLGQIEERLETIDATDIKGLSRCDRVFSTVATLGIQRSSLSQTA
jgi:hypothetical protein